MFQDVVEAYQVLSDPERRRRYNQGLRPVEGREEPQSVPIIVGHQRQPEPLVPESLSVLHGVQEIPPSVEALVERLRRNFTAVGVPTGERLEGLQVEILLHQRRQSEGGSYLLESRSSLPARSAAALDVSGSFRVRTVASRG